MIICILIYVYIHLYAYIYMYTCICVHIYIYICLWNLSLFRYSFSNFTSFCLISLFPLSVLSSFSPLSRLSLGCSHTTRISLFSHANFSIFTARVCMCESFLNSSVFTARVYGGVATVSRIDKITGLFCKRAL